jgi:PII-like signaling protein
MKKLQLTVYLNEADRSTANRDASVDNNVPLHETVVRRLLHAHIGGATVLRGVMGYGKHGRVHRTRLFGVSDDRPIVIIAIDEEERIRAVLPELRLIVTEGLMTLHEVEVA